MAKVLGVEGKPSLCVVFNFLPLDDIMRNPCDEIGLPTPKQHVARFFGFDVPDDYFEVDPSRHNGMSMIVLFNTRRVQITWNIQTLQYDVRDPKELLDLPEGSWYFNPFEKKTHIHLPSGHIATATTPVVFLKDKATAALLKLKTT